MLCEAYVLWPTLCAATFSNNFKWPSRYVMLRFVAVQVTPSNCYLKILNTELWILRYCTVGFEQPLYPLNIFTQNSCTVQRLYIVHVWSLEYAFYRNFAFARGGAKYLPVGKHERINISKNKPGLGYKVHMQIQKGFCSSTTVAYLFISGLWKFCRLADFF